MLRAEGRRSLVKLVLLLTITLLAAFLRLYRIDSLPPGDGYDPAFYGLDALSILQGERPIFFETNLGREAMFSYLVAACVALLGVGPYAIYTASAIAGIVTVPAVYLMGEELFAGEKGALGRYGGLLAALVLALSYWHLSWSRLGVRAILVPLFATTTMYLLWRGLRTGSHWSFAACGFSLGLSLYTYQAARLFPALVLLALAYALWSRRPLSKRDALHLALVLGTAGITFAPLGYYYLAHPGISDLRIEQTLVVSPAQDLSHNMNALLAQLADVAQTFFYRGDNWPKVNVLGHPLLDPFLSAAFLLGVVASLFQIKKPTYFLLLAWLAVMAAPAVLADRGPVSKRAIGALPAAVMLVTVGSLTLWDGGRHWLTRRHAGYLSAGLALLIGAGFAYSGVRTGREYFVTWGENPDLFTYFEAGLSAMGQYAWERPPGERLYLSSVAPEHPSVGFNSRQRPGIKGYNGRFCMVVVDQAAHDTTYVIVPSDDKNSLGLLQEYLPQGRVTDQGPLHYQLPYFLAYLVPAGTPAQLPPFTPLQANWDNKIGLLGYALDSPAYAPGDTIHLTLYYRALGKVDKDYTVFTHLLGTLNPATGGPLWAQSDSEPCRRGYRTSVWEADEVVIDHFELAIPTQAPPGEYELEMGFYDWHTLERLPVLDANGQPASDHVTLIRLRVATVP
jgi:4-amino-4-deoxy-L-arabinose transferase-like glycosyltransferase